MFPVLKSEVETRFDTIEQFLTAAVKLQSGQMAVAKGLVFIQIYAVYEFTINRTVNHAIEAIKTHNHKLEDISPSLLALFLDPELRSLRDATRKNEWHNRIRLFERTFSGEYVDLSSETNPPTDGSHYRDSHLTLIFRVFGITRIPATRHSHLQRIREVVDHRNAIAHGRETPEDVGRRYTPAEIRKAISQMRSVCMFWIRVFDSYCADPNRHRR